MNIMRHAALLLLLLAAARLGDARQQPQSHLSTHPAATDARLPWELYTGCAKEPVNPVQVAAIRTKRQSQPTEELTESEDEYEELKIQLGDNLLKKHFYGGRLTAADISRTVAERLDPIHGIYAQVARSKNKKNKKNKGKLPNNFKPPASFTLLLGDVPRGTELTFERTVRNGQELYQSERTFSALKYGLNDEGVYEFKGESELKLELPGNIVEEAKKNINNWARLNHFQSKNPRWLDARAAKFDRNEMRRAFKHELGLRNQYNTPPRSQNKPERPNPHSRPRGSSQERIKSPEDGSDFSDNHNQVRKGGKSCKSKDVRVTPKQKRCLTKKDREGDDANHESREANVDNNYGVNDNDNGNDNDNENDGNYERGD